jgi:hypothetical protein
MQGRGGIDVREITGIIIGLMDVGNAEQIASVRLTLPGGATELRTLATPVGGPIDDLRELANACAKGTGHRVRLVMFTAREILETFEPDGAGGEDVPAIPG